LDDYMRVITINQVGTFLGMKAVAEPMIQQGSGSIVNISSVAGLRGNPALIAYTASKFAIRGMTKVAAAELGPFGIRVNSVHPGLIDTAMLTQLKEAAGEARVEDGRNRISLGRFGDVDDVAALVLYLVSDDSKYSTGSEFVVDGGLTSRA
jgi:3alpha(or 20beta)-hydroxysteroid dehydrogenase